MRSQTETLGLSTESLGAEVNRTPALSVAGAASSSMLTLSVVYYTWWAPGYLLEQSVEITTTLSNIRGGYWILWSVISPAKACPRTCLFTFSIVK